MHQKRILSRLLPFAAFTAVLIGLAGCAVSGRDMRSTVDDFIAAVNARDAAAVKATLHSGAAAYNQAATADWFVNYFPKTDYKVGTYAATGDTATVSFIPTVGADLAYTFELTADAGDMMKGTTYYIKKIKNSASSGYFFE